ncbi:hypothetical protein BAUCODRAFT_22772 [Baudoinia panamericana UAMH 10762]|uniref:FAD-binding domain-containing protein n=1 Tax=Baudoinia panamericana (strain UAMH 10762) TaxID=717646 RepID=M2LTN5_BAUPA|nr:uncharacterized protein BAUCODRAFT_22772 [Baudoinia panamericana UAMH 10762]EMC97897.1 hypothetical protein BAUCODRAFT_22772 [Baudoinia panamericana UAMH 10762]
MDTTSNSSRPLLIIGAGIAGLILAQACRKHNLPYALFERDASPHARSAGWGLTLHWSYATLRSLLPEDILLLLPQTYVNKVAVERGEIGSFAFFDLSTGESRWRVPLPMGGERIRVSRERLRSLLHQGLEMEWGKTLVGVKKGHDGVVAVFNDATEVEGCMVVGCDGARSQVRRLCHGDDSHNSQLPVRFIGAGARYPETSIAEIRKLDPFFLQGSDPRTNAFLWFSFLNTPSDPGSISTEADEHTVDSEASTGKLYRCQIMTSWPYRPGFLDCAEPVEVPESKVDQLKWMKKLAEDWVEPFRSLVQGISEDSEVKPIDLADWLPRSTAATPLGQECGGRIALVGDAGHAMVMYRGEGANHAIVDVGRLFELVKPLMDGRSPSDNGAWQTAIEEYEREMIERSSTGVKASRQACLDAHDWSRLNDESPLVKRRVMREDLEAAPQPQH